MTQQRGRLTEAQRRALDTLLPQLALDVEQPLDVRTAFGRDGPLGVEIGFGTGDALASWSLDAPDWNLLGIEIYPPGIGALLNRIERESLSGIRIAMGRAEDVVANVLTDGSVGEIRIYFPDPWPKKRHHKRRLIQPVFVDRLVARLAPGGRIRFATDWQPYAEWASGVFMAHAELSQEAEEPVSRPITRFEQRGLRLGHSIFEATWVKRRIS